MPKINIGSPAPDFVLEDMHGNEFQLSQATAEGAVLLIFNRGFM